MEVRYKSNSLEQHLDSAAQIKKNYGKISRRIERCINVLKNVENLKEISKEATNYKLHLLKPKQEAPFALSISHNQRLIITPAHDPIPRNKDNGIDLQQITKYCRFEC